MGRETLIGGDIGVYDTMMTINVMSSFLGATVGRWKEEPVSNLPIASNRQLSFFYLLIW